MTLPAPDPELTRARLTLEARALRTRLREVEAALEAAPRRQPRTLSDVFTGIVRRLTAAGYTPEQIHDRYPNRTIESIRALTDTIPKEQQ